MTVFLLIIFCLALIGTYFLFGELYFITTYKSNPLYKFKVSGDPYGGEIIKETKDEKYYWITLVCFWLFFLLLYDIPKGLLKLIRFIIDYVSWAFNKIKKRYENCYKRRSI